MELLSTENIAISNDERVVGIFKEHYFVTLFRSLAFTLVIIVLLFWLKFNLVGVIGVIWALAGTIATLIYDRNKTILLITTNRLIFIQTDGFFAQKTQEVPFDKIQNVAVGQFGPLKLLAGYGDLEIQMAGQGTEKLKFGSLEEVNAVKNANR